MTPTLTVQLRDVLGALPRPIRLAGFLQVLSSEADRYVHVDRPEEMRVVLEYLREDEAAAQAGHEPKTPTSVTPISDAELREMDSLVHDDHTTRSVIAAGGIALKYLPRLLSEVRGLREDQQEESAHSAGCPNWRVDLMLDRLPDGAVIERRESGYAVTLPGRPMCMAPTLRRALVAFDLDQPLAPSGGR